MPTSRGLWSTNPHWVGASCTAKIFSLKRRKRGLGMTLSPLTPHSNGTSKSPFPQTGFALSPSVQSLKSGLWPMPSTVFNTYRATETPVLFIDRIHMLQHHQSLTQQRSEGRLEGWHHLSQDWNSLPWKKSSTHPKSKKLFHPDKVWHKRWTDSVGPIALSARENSPPSLYRKKKTQVIPFLTHKRIPPLRLPFLSQLIGDGKGQAKGEEYASVALFPSGALPLAKSTTLSNLNGRCLDWRATYLSLKG